MTAYALIFVNFPAGATLDEVAVLYHSDMSAFYWHCLLLQPLIQTSPHHQHHHHIFHDQHNDRQHHHDQHQVPANMTSISGLTPSRPMALSTSFLLGFSDACFITQVESSSLSASLFFFLFILVQVWFQVTSVLGGVWKLQAPAAFGIFKFLQVEKKQPTNQQTKLPSTLLTNQPTKQLTNKPTVQSI